MKIKAINKLVKGMKLSVPFDGIINIDGNGIADVSQKAAKALVTGTNDWEYLEDAAEEGEADEVNDEDVVAGIKKMKIEDMIALAKESGYPKEEWKRFEKKPKLFSGYLIGKYNAEKDAAEEGEE